MSNATATVTVTKGLELQVLTFSRSGAQQLRLKLTRVEAQRIAETLKAFANGSTTKSAGYSSRDVFIAEVLR